MLYVRLDKVFKNGPSKVCERQPACLKQSSECLSTPLLRLGAAKYFYDHNMKNFLVLEGNDYIGGRMKNQMFGDVSVALGAGWIHLAEENHIFVKLANQYNLTRKLDNYDIGGVVVRYI